MDDIYTLKQIKEMLLPEIDISYNQLHKWQGTPTTDFPKPVKQLSRYKFYDLAEVREWVTLWLRATKNMSRNSNGRQFNGTR